MIQALERNPHHRLSGEPAVIPLAQRVTGEGDGTGAERPLIDQMVEHMAVQQFVQALLEGEPELTGVPAVSLDGEY